jgi:hypothetical protein
MNRIMKGMAFAPAMALAIAAHATRAEAQRSTTPRRPVTKPRNRIAVPDGRRTGFVLGVYTMAAPGVTITGADIDGGPFKTGFGPGAGAMVGYGFNRTFTGFAALDLAKQSAPSDYGSGSFGLSHMEIGARANLPFGDGATVPYVSASVGRRGLGARVSDQLDGTTYDMKLTGGMFGVGGGVEHVISPTLAVDGGLTIGFGRFGHADIDGDSGPMDVNGSTTMRLRFGMTWRPAPVGR